MTTQAALQLQDVLNEHGAGVELAYQDEDDTNDPARLRVERDTLRQLVLFANFEYSFAQTELGRLRVQLDQNEQRHQLTQDLTVQLAQHQDELRDLKATHAADLRVMRATHAQALVRANEDVQELVHAQKTSSHRVRDASSSGLMKLEAELRRNERTITVLALVAQHIDTENRQIDQAQILQSTLDVTISQLGSARTTIDTLTSQLRIMTTECDVARDTNSALQVTLENQRDHIRSQTGLLEAELREAVQAYAALKADKASVEKQWNDDKAAAATALERARMELTCAHWETRCVYAEVAELDEDRTALTIALATLGLSRPLIINASQGGSLTSQLATSLSNRSAPLESAYSQIDALKSYIDSLETRSIKLSTRLVEEQARVARRNEQIFAHQREIARLSTNSALADEALEEMEAMKRDLDWVVADADQVRDARDAAMRRIDELEDRLAGLDATGGWTRLLERRKSTQDLEPAISPNRVCSSPARETVTEVKVEFDLASSPARRAPIPEPDFLFSPTPRPVLITRSSTEMALFDFAAAAASARAPSDVDDNGSMDDYAADLSRSLETDEQETYSMTDVEKPDVIQQCGSRSAVFPASTLRSNGARVADATPDMVAPVPQLPVSVHGDDIFAVDTPYESEDVPLTLNHGPLVGSSPFMLVVGTPPRRAPAPTPSRWNPDDAPILTPPRRTLFPATSAAPLPSRRGSSTPPVVLMPKHQASSTAPSPTTDRPRFAFATSPTPLTFAVAADSPTSNRTPLAPRFTLSRLPTVTPSPTPRRCMVPGPTPVHGRVLQLDEEDGDGDGDSETPVAARRIDDVALKREVETLPVVNLDDTLEFVLSRGRKGSPQSPPCVSANVDTANAGVAVDDGSTCEESDIGISLAGSQVVSGSEYEDDDASVARDKLVVRVRELEVELAMAREQMVVPSTDDMDASELYNRIIQAGRVAGSHESTTNLQTFHAGLVALARIRTFPASASQLASDLIQTSSELDALHIDYDTLVNDHSVLHADCLALMSEMRTAEFELDALASEIEALHAQLNNAALSAEKKDDELVEARSAVDGLRERVQKLEERRDELELALTEAEATQGNNAELRSTVIALEDQVQGLEHEVAALQGAVESGDSEKASLVAVVFALHADVRESKRLLHCAISDGPPFGYLRFSQLESNHSGDESNVWTIGELRDRVDLFEQEVSDLREELGQMRERARDADLELSDAKSQLFDARALTLRQELALADRAGFYSSTDPTALEIRITELEGAMVSSQAALAATQDKLAEQHRLSDGLVDKLRAARDTLDNERAASRRKLVQLEIQLDDISEEREVEKDRADDASARVAELERELHLVRVQMEEHELETSQKEEVRVELAETKGQLAAKDALAAELGVARLKLSDLKLQLVGAEKDKMEHANQRAALERRVKELVKDVADKKEVERDMWRLQRELAQVAQEREDLDDQAANLNDQLVGLRQLVMEKDTELELVNVRLHRAELNLEDFKSAHEHAIRMQGQMEVIEADLKAKYDECEALDERLVDVLKEKRRAEGRAEILARKVDGLENLLDEMRVRQQASPPTSTLPSVTSAPNLSALKSTAHSPTESTGVITLQPPRRGAGLAPTPTRIASESILSPTPILTRPVSTTPVLTRSSSSTSSVRLVRPTTSMDQRTASHPASHLSSRSATLPLEATSASTTPTQPRVLSSLYRPTNDSTRIEATGGTRILSVNSRVAVVATTSARRPISPHMGEHPMGNAASSRVPSARSPHLGVAPPRFPKRPQLPPLPRRPSVEAAAQRTNVRSMAAAIASAQSMPSLTSVVPNSSPSSGRKRSVPDDFDTSIVEGALPVSVPVSASRPLSLAAVPSSRPITELPAHRNPGGFVPQRTSSSAQLVLPAVSPNVPKRRVLGGDLTNVRDENDLRTRASRAIKRDDAADPLSQNAPPNPDVSGPGRVESMRARFFG